MRIFYSFEELDNKYVSEIQEIWFYTEDTNMYKGRIYFDDTTGNTIRSEVMNHSTAKTYLEQIARYGYLNFENTIFELCEDE